MLKTFEDKLIDWAGKISRSTVLNVIQHSFMQIFPFMMIGSIFALIAGLPIEAYTNMLAATGLDVLLQIPVQYTTEFISVYLVYAVAYNYCVEKGNKKNAVVNGLISLFAFMILVPYQVVGEGWEAVTSIPFTYTGAKGMFIALFVGFGVGALCTTAYKKKWTIKMPDSVPPFVANSFSSLIPAFIVAFLFLIIRFVFSFTPWGSVFNAFYTLLQKPLSVVTSGPWGVAIIETVSMTLWWLGIHGGAVTYQIKNILFAENRLGNLAAYAAGEQMTHAVTGLFLTPGVLPLIFMCFVVGRSQRTKSVTKVAAVPAIFGISEPINFGLPTVLNPLMAIPTIITYPLAVFYTYALNMAGLLPYCNGTQIRNCPYFILAFVQFGGFVGLFWWIVLFAICCAIYFPFVKALDKQYVKEEMGKETNDSLVGQNASNDTITITCAKPEKIVEAFDNKEVVGQKFAVINIEEHSVTVNFDSSNSSKEEVVKLLNKFMKEDSYFSGLMVQIK
ncbi:MAG: PTS sugar transporter subunit IIC [Pseudobutyrivibrio ruminis]|nr:PTS sugar transporter subunit IIC [Pseudobutyrivibrio ruminis]